MLSGLCYWRWLMYQYLRLWCLCNYVEFICLWNEIRAWCVRDWLRSRYWTIQSIRWSSSGLHWNDRRCVWLIILIDTNNWDNKTRSTPFRDFFFFFVEEFHWRFILGDCEWTTLCVFDCAHPNVKIDIFWFSLGFIPMKHNAENVMNAPLRWSDFLLWSIVNIVFRRYTYRTRTKNRSDIAANTSEWNLNEIYGRRLM